MDANAPRRLLLLRHAKSAWPDEVADQDRPLARRGRRDAPVAGRWLRQAGYVPDHVLCSTARRARETWQLAEQELVVRPPVVYEPGVYIASARSLLHIVRRQPPSARTVVVVGHDPSLPELALELAAGSDHPDRRAAARPPGAPLGRMQAKFPTAAIAVLELTASWAELWPGQAHLANFVTPRDMDDGRPGGHGQKRSAEDGPRQ
jgi:phosphohistidine phosphatase